MLLKTDPHLLLESFPSNLSIPQNPTLLQPLPSDFTSFEHIPCDPTIRLHLLGSAYLVTGEEAGAREELAVEAGAGPPQPGGPE